MLKFNCFILTITLSFFSLFLFKTEGTTVHKTVTPTEDIKIDEFYNASAITTNNSFHERLGVVKQKLTSAHFNHAVSNLKNGFLEEGVQYLKVCNLIDLNLTVRLIIYPFHVFL